MRRGAKPAKAKVEAKAHAARKSPKNEGSRVHDLEKRLTEALEREAEALERETATSEILRVISASPANLQGVLDTVAASAARLCDSVDAQIFRIDGTVLRIAASYGQIPKTTSAEARPINRGSVNGRAVVDRQTVHVHDLAAESDHEFPIGKAYQKLFGHRTVVATPLLREGTPIGAITIRRMEVRPFSEKEITLLETFAAQAVIAIENVRLFKELDARNHELVQALERETATGDILRVISGSPTDIRPVLDAVAASAARLCESFDSVIHRRDGDRLLLVAHHGPIPVGPVGEFTFPLVRGTGAGRAVLDGRTIHLADIQTEVDEFPEGSELARQQGIRTILSVPLMREGAAIGAIILRRAEAALHPAAGRPARDLRRPGGHRHRERPPVHRAAGEQPRSHPSAGQADSNE
jgi:GAF domain-containing protein